MSNTQVSAPGKVILFGEHAVVYGQPAIAAPVSQVRATATVAARNGEGVRLVAPDLGRSYWLAEAAMDDPLAAAVFQVQQAAALDQLPGLEITVRSTIPIASGLGSGASIAAALIRALTRHLELPQLSSNEQISQMTYQVEKILHGTPSGIDNTVVSYEQPVYFMRRQPHNLIELFTLSQPLRVLVADTGVRSSTRVVVGDVRRQWQADPTRFEALFAACGRLAKQARQALALGNLERVGRLMNENHTYLQQITVSSKMLDSLVEAARDAGALGAKLSGAGRGGNMIALVRAETEPAVHEALRLAGAVNILSSSIG